MVSFSDCSSVSSSCMVSSVFSFCCSSVCNSSFSSSSISMSYFSFIFMVNQSSCFQFLSYVLFSSAVMAFIPCLTFGSLFLRTPPFSCFCWHHFFSCSYSVLETGVLLVFVFFVLLSTTVLSPKLVTALMIHTLLF